MKQTFLKVLICFIFLSGCSTLQTLNERSIKHWPGIELYNECNNYELHGITQQIVYSGLRRDVAFIVLPFNCSGEACWGAMLYPLILPYYLVDLPFSAIADTIAFPHTRHIQYEECPKVDRIDLLNRQELLNKRIKEYYSNYSNVEHVRVMSSLQLKNSISLDKFINSDYRIKDEHLAFTSSGMAMSKDRAKVRMINSKHFHSIYDYWVYENNNWYIEKPNQKK